MLIENKIYYKEFDNLVRIIKSLHICVKQDDKLYMRELFDFTRPQELNSVELVTLLNEKEYEVWEEYDSIEQFVVTKHGAKLMESVRTDFKMEMIEEDFKPSQVSYYGWRGIDQGEGTVDFSIHANIYYQDNIIYTYNGYIHLVPYKESWSFLGYEPALDEDSFELKNTIEQTKDFLSDLTIDIEKSLLPELYISDNVDKNIKLLFEQKIKIYLSRKSVEKDVDFYI